MARMSRSQQKAMFSRKIPKVDLQRLRELDDRTSRLTQDERFEISGKKFRLAKIKHGKIPDLKTIKINLKTGILTRPRLPSDKHK